jgi:hypothetical protein
MGNSLPNFGGLITYPQVGLKIPQKNLEQVYSLLDT